LGKSLVGRFWRVGFTMPRRRVSAQEELEDEGPSTELKKGEEVWFQVEAGLPRGGLDPEKDTTHVSDEELIKVFGRKVPNRGYLYKDAVVGKITMRAEELYKPIYQVASLPEQYISESFARALVSEICHLMPMNWSRYAEGVWARKKGDEEEQRKHKNAPTIRFNPGPETTYGSIILERLQKEVRDEDALFRDASNMLQGIRKTLEEITDRATMDVSEVEGRAQLNRLIKRKKLALDMVESNLAFAWKFIQEVSSEFESDLLEEYRIREAVEDQNVKECQDQLDEVLQKRLQYDKSLMDAIKQKKCYKLKLIVSFQN
jgi:hypothetical protein